MAHAAERSDRRVRPADDNRRPAVQDCGRAVPSVGAGRLRRRADQRHRLHVGCGESRRMGDAAADLPLRPGPAALDVCAAADLRLDRHHDRRQPGGDHAEQPEAAAGVLVDRARRLHAAGPGRQRRREQLHGHHGHHDLPAGVHVHEPRRVRGDHLAAAAQHHRRRDRRHRRAVLQGPSGNHADAGVPAVAGGNSSAGRLLGQVLHLPQPDPDRALHAGGGRPCCTP